jgi:hypothetical protein
MSQNSRNQQSDNRGDPGRGMNDGRDSRRYEGFEGMNYEQVRQPYPSDEAGKGRNNETNNNSDNNRNDEI